MSSRNETPIEIDVQMTLKNDLARKLVAEAKRLGRSPVELMADIVERVLGDNLVSAVIDD